MKYFWPAIIWSIFIFVISSLPGDDVPKSFILSIPFADKLIHFVLYFLLVIFVLFGFFKKSENVLTTNKYLFAFIISLFYGILLEVLQDFVFIMRSADFFDVLANTAGAFTGLITFNYYTKRKRNI